MAMVKFYRAFILKNLKRQVGRTRMADTKGLKIRNRRKLCELKSMYHIEDNGIIIFRYIHYSASILENEIASAN